MNTRRRFHRIAVAGLAVLAYLALVALVVPLLWNALIPEIFAGPTLNYWQALGLLILVQILLRGTALPGLGAWRYARWRRKRCTSTPQDGDDSAENMVDETKD